MKTLSTLVTVALITACILSSAPAEEPGEGAFAASLGGGLDAGALLNGATSGAHSAPGYGYGRPVAYDDYPRTTDYGEECDYDETPAYVPGRRTRPARDDEALHYDAAGWDLARQ